MRTRRVGTLTLGLSLVTFGCIFLLHIFNAAISYDLILRLWPVIFIFLGIEILVSHFTEKDNQFKYDIGAFFILAMLTFFAMGMACIEMAMEYAYYHM